MPRMKYLIFCLTLIFLKCATFISETPQDNSDSIIIGLTATISRTTIGELYFIKLEDNDSYLSDKEVIQANFSIGNQFYLLNARPGRYIIVAAYYKNEDKDSKGKLNSIRHDMYYFPFEFIKTSDITVEKGNIYYLGDYDFWFSPSLTWGINKSDEAQSFYCNRFQPNLVKPNLGSVAIDVLNEFLTDESDTARAITLNKDKRIKQTEIQFWEDTIEGLKPNYLQKKLDKERVANNEEWINIINKKLLLLKNKI